MLASGQEKLAPGCYRKRKGWSSVAFGGQGKYGWAWKPWRKFVPRQTLRTTDTSRPWAEFMKPDDEEHVWFMEAA